MLLPSILSKTEETTDTTMLNSKAENQLSTSNPLTRPAAHFMIRIFIISKNKPKVRMVIGMVRITSMGFTKVFNSPSTKATINAVDISLICTPLNKYDATSIASVVKSNLVRNFDI